MPKQNIIATNFTSGEVSPLVRGRVDAQKYANGLETCENFIVRPQGPLCRRSGSKYLGPIKFPGNRAILIPFEYSDTQGYVLEFGRGYIHFWKNNGMVFETTNTEIESFNTASNGGLIQVIAPNTDLPLFGTTGYGTTVIRRKGSYPLISTSVPHTLRTGAKVAIQIGATKLLNKTVTRVTDYSFTIDQAWDASYDGTTPLVYTSGVLPGDRIYISGASDIPEINNKFAIVQSHNGWSGSEEEQFTLNIPFFTNDTNPSQEELWCIPIEISTDYGYEPRKAISSTVDVGGFTYVNIANHGFTDDDTIEIFQTNTGADGEWSITKITDNQFKLNGSTPVYNTATTGFARKKLNPLEDELKKIRVAQSNDVIYIMHPSHPVYKLTRLSNDGDVNDWSYSKVDFKDGPYLPLNDASPIFNTSTPSNGTRFPDVALQLTDYTHTATAICGYYDNCTIANNATAGRVTVTTPYPHGIDIGDTVYVTNYTGANTAGYTGYFAAASIPSTTTFTYDIASGTRDGNQTATIYTGPFLAACAGEYFEYREGDQWRLGKIPTTLAANALSIEAEIIDNVLLYLDETTKFKVKYNASGVNTTPAVFGAGKQKKLDPNNAFALNTGIVSANYSNTFGNPDIGKYLRVTDAPTWHQISGITPTATSSGKQCSVSAAVTINRNNDSGMYEVKNHKRIAKLNAIKSNQPFSIFSTTDVGRIFRLGFGDRWTWGKITAYVSASQVSVELYEDPPRDPHDATKIAGEIGQSNTSGKTFDWRLGEWSDSTGYPSCGAFHEQRLWFASTASNPQTIWASTSGDFENFRPTELDSTVLDDNGIGFTLGSTKANSIKWLVPGTSLSVGTTGGEWQVKSSSATSEPITPTNIVVVPHTEHGSHYLVQPIKIGPYILFCDRPGKKVRELVYDFSVDSLASKDLTYISEHLFRNGGGAIASAYQQEPNNLCWFVMDDGTLSCLTINKEQEIIAWHRHTIAGGEVESIAVVPGLSNSRDLVYMVVQRGENRYVELLQDDFYPASPSTKTNMMFLDGLVELDSKFKGTTIAGLHHLEGKYVTVTMNGVPLSSTYQVSGGSITISPSQTDSEMHVGLAYTSTAKSLPPEGGSIFGTSQGKIKKIAKYNVRLLNSLELSYGFDANGQSLNSITNLHENGTSTDFYTGTKELIPNNPYDAESQWTLSTSKPYPLNILSVTMTVEAGE